MIKTAFPKTQTQIINSQQQLPFCFLSPGLDKREDTTDYHSLGTVLPLKTPYDEVLHWTCDMKKRQWVEHQHNFKFRIISYKVTSKKYEYVGPWWLMMIYSYCTVAIMWSLSINPPPQCIISYRSINGPKTEVCTLRAALAVPVLPLLSGEPFKRSDVPFLCCAKWNIWQLIHANTVQALAIWYRLIIDYFVRRQLQRVDALHYVVKDRWTVNSFFVILPLQVPRHFQIQEEEEQAPCLGYVGQWELLVSTVWLDEHVVRCVM